MARCNDCNKFVSYGDIQAEIVSEQVDNDTVTVEVRIALPCADCGAELKETTLTFEQEIDHTCEAEPGEGEQYEITGSSADGTDRRQTIDKQGKPITNYRYQKQFYGASVAVEVQCNWCSETFDVSGDVEEQASAFDEA